MDSVIINGEEPKLLQLTVWFEGKYEKGTKVTIQVGTRAPLIHNDYIPAARVYFYYIATPSELPTIQISYKSHKISVNLSQYEQGGNRSIRGEDFTLWFIYELMNKTQKLQRKYWNIKEPEDKVARGEGLNNFVRAESEFLAVFERDEDIQQIKAAEIEQQKIEREISEEIISLQRTKVEIKMIIVLAIVFLLAGYFWRSLQGPNKPDSIKHGNLRSKRQHKSSEQKGKKRKA